LRKHRSKIDPFLNGFVLRQATPSDTMQSGGTGGRRESAFERSIHTVMAWKRAGMREFNDTCWDWREAFAWMGGYYK